MQPLILKSVYPLHRSQQAQAAAFTMVAISTILVGSLPRTLTRTTNESQDRQNHQVHPCCGLTATP